MNFKQQHFVQHEYESFIKTFSEKQIKEGSLQMIKTSDLPQHNRERNNTLEVV